MKKLLTAACALVAGMAMAQVQSANIVGYQQVTLTQKNTILGVNFVAVDGTTSIALQDAIPYVTGMAKGNSANTADQIQIQNSSGGYDIYFMSNGLNGKSKVVDGLEGKWTTAASGAEQYKPVTVTLAPGTAFWFIRKDATNPLTINIVGGVSMLGSNDKGIDGTYKLIANPFPTDLPLNPGIPYVAGMTKGNSANTADQIQIQNASGGYDVYFMSNGLNGKSKVVDGLEGKWTTAASGAEQYKPVSASISAGKGAWFIRKGSTDFDITIARPYSIQ